MLARSYKKGTTTEDINRAAQKDLGIDTDELNAKFNSYVEKAKERCWSRICICCWNMEFYPTVALQDKWEETDEKPAVVAIFVAVFIGIWATSGAVTYTTVGAYLSMGVVISYAGLLSSCGVRSNALQSACIQAVHNLSI